MWGFWGYSKPQSAIVASIDEDDALKQGIIDELGRIQETTLINESGLYSLLCFARYAVSFALASFTSGGS